MRQRSAMFFESDLMRASEDAAAAMADHGLTDDQVEALGTEIAETIRECFRVARDSVSETDARDGGSILAPSDRAGA